MKSALIGRRLIKASIAIAILVYFMLRTTGPKMIFVPFLFCAFASIGKSLGLLFDQKRIALFFDRAFKIVFFLSWFGFLAAVCYVWIKGGEYGKLLFTIPFWLGGIFFAKRKFLGSKDR